MGFGRGIDAEARKGAVLVGTGHAWQATSVAMLPSFEQIYFVVPQGTPSDVDLGRLDAAARDAHAVKLVTAASPTGIAADRSLVGDARDLLAQVFRRMLPGLSGGSTTRLFFLDTPTLPPRAPGLTLYVHVGKTPQALEMLGAMRLGDSVWDGDLDALDGDGYVNLLVHPALAPGQALSLTAASHLLLVGGSDYGTYFAVAAFCQKHLGVRWLFPGELGTVVPATVQQLTVGGLVNEFEEPAVRSRTFAGLSSTAPHTAAEIDEIRAWQLRNRLRPHDDMAKLFQRVHGAMAHCATPFSLEFTTAALEVEERVPTDHMIHTFLSPHKVPLTGRTTDLRTRGEGTALVNYPELRHRDLPTDQARDTFLSTTPTVHVQLGQRSHTIRFSRENDLCQVMTNSCCRAAPSPDNRRMVVRASDGDLGFLANYRTALGDTFSHTTLGSGEVIGPPLGRDSRNEPLDRTLRFVPKAFEHHLSGVHFTFGNWHPCIFDAASTPPGEPLRARASLALDLATQVMLSAHGRRLRGRDLTHSISFDDLDTWCQCDACTRVDDDGGGGNEFMFYLGHLIAHQAFGLEREANLPRGDTLLDASAVPARLAYLADSFGGMRGRTARFVWGRENNPFFGLSFDALAARGCVWAQGYPRTRTRRVLTLLNAVCDDLQQALDAARRGQPLPGTGMQFPMEKRLAPRGEDPVLGFHAYAQYMAPPMSAPQSVGVGELCHDFLMPYMTGVRDTLEYQQEGANPYDADAALPASPVGALARMKAAPDQFNHERWSRIARRTGLYEYFSSAGYVGPHLYANRMMSAIRRGVRHHRLRGFVGEMTPNWGFDAPMLWELPQMLWDPQTLTIPPHARQTDWATFSRRASLLRWEFCTHAFGRGREWMLCFFEMCEEAWAATRDGWRVYNERTPLGLIHPDRRLRSGQASGFFGDGYAGRGNWLSTLDGFLEEPSPGGARNRLLLCWRFLNDALQQANDDGSRARVQLFRRSFGLTLLIGLWYEPVRAAFESVRRQRIDLVAMQKMIELRKQVVNVSGATEPLFTATGPSTTTNVTVQNGYARIPPPPPPPPPGTPPGPRAMLGAEQVAALRDVIAPLGRNGLRDLRNEVHRYLALSIASPSMGDFPTFARHTAEIGGLQDIDIGLGLFAPASSLATDAAFPGAGAAMAGPHRLMGLWPPGLAQYVDWWNGIPRGTDQDMNRNVLTQRVRLLPPFVGPTSAPDPGFGWIFSALKDLAGATVLYADDLTVRQREDWGAALVRG